MAPLSASGSAPCNARGEAAMTFTAGGSSEASTVAKAGARKAATSVERSAVEALSETPPDQWGTLLGALGASFKSVDDAEKTPCTVTSLLGMMGPAECTRGPSPTPEP